MCMEKEYIDSENRGNKASWIVWQKLEYDMNKIKKISGLTGSQILTGLYIAAVGFLLLMICSRSSFLYPMNNWDDVNSYFTMGKGMMNGLVIYRDLYEQKGPYLYFLYGLAYLISHRTFAGVFAFEVVAAAFFLLFAYKSMRLFCSRSAALILLPLLGACIYVSRSFYWGGAAEEFCLPFLAYALYCSLSVFRQKEVREPSLRMIFINGICAGIVLQVKYTMAGFYAAWFFMMMLIFIKSRSGKKLLQACLVFAGAFLITMIPWIIYFGIHGALGDWYQVYIYNNLFIYTNYSKTEESGNLLYSLLKVLYNLAGDNRSYFSFIVFGMAAVLIDQRNGWMAKLNILLMSSLLFLNIFIGGSTLPYYSIPLMVFVLPGYAYAGKILDCMMNRIGWKRLWQIPAAVSLICGLLMVTRYSMNVPFMHQDKDTFFVYRFADIISQEQNPTLANIGCLDVGLCTVTGIIPICRFFQTNAISLQEMNEEQADCIANGRTQFIVMRDSYPDNIEIHYTLVAQAPYQWGNYHFTYYLFKRTK